MTTFVDVMEREQRQALARVRERERAGLPPAGTRPPTHYEEHHKLLGRVTKAYRMMELIELDLQNLGSGQAVFLAVRTCRLIMGLQKKLLLHCFKVTWQYSDMMREEEKRIDRLYSSHALYPKRVGGTHARTDLN